MAPLCPSLEEIGEVGVESAHIGAACRLRISADQPTSDRVHGAGSSVDSEPGGPADRARDPLQACENAEVVVSLARPGSVLQARLRPGVCVKLKDDGPRGLLKPLRDFCRVGSQRGIIADPFPTAPLQTGRAPFNASRFPVSCFREVTSAVSA